MNIHIWVPDYSAGAGGILTFSRLLVRALRDLYPTSDISVFSKNDPDPIDLTNDPADSFAPSGSWALPQRTAIWAWTLLRAGLWQKPDLIVVTHANFTPVAKLLRKLRAIPYLAIGHGIEVWQLRNPSAGPGLRAANILLAVSEFTRQRMAKVIDISPDQIGILPNTFEEESFAPAPKPQFLLERYGLRPEQPVILTIARLAGPERYKGYDKVLRAIPAVRERFPDVRYVLGGRGRDQDRIEGLIRELGVEENVTLAGYVSDEELCAHYNLCDVFAMPSKGEGFGIVFLEAMACGKPVIAGNKDGSVDALLGSELGVLIDPDNLQELTEALASVLTEVGSQRSEAGSQTPAIHDSPSISKTPAPASQPLSPISGLPAPNSLLRLPAIIFDPEALRAKVVEHFGYEKFKQRLGEILEPLLEKLKAEN